MRSPPLNSARSNQRPGYVLLAVLIVIVVLSLAAYRYSDMTSAEFKATHNILQNTQAKALADSGIYYAMAALADPNAYANTLGGNPFNNPDAFSNVSVDLGNGKFGYFSIMCLDYSQVTQGSQTTVPLIYGVIDESSRINPNAIMQIDTTGTVLTNMLTAQTGLNMDVALASSIINWMGGNLSAGVTSSYYEGLTAPNGPYACKNAPLDSVEELLLVSGMSPYMLYGTDLNRNGYMDGNESTLGNTFSPGYAPFLTVYSRTTNVSSAGTPRININAGNLQSVYTQLNGVVSQQMAAYIVAYRALNPPTGKSKAVMSTPTAAANLIANMVSGNSPPRSQRNIASIYQLIGTSVVIPGGKGKPDTIFPCPIQGPTTAGTDLATLADQTTTVNAMSLPARINVNTASLMVLNSLPGLTTDDINNIISARPPVGSADAASPMYMNTAWLYTTANISAIKMIALERYITALTQVYRIQAIGYFEKGGPVARVEAVVDINGGQPRILYYRDLTDLGRAIDPRTLNNGNGNGNN